MDFQKLLKEHHPELYNMQFTEQYALGEIILDYMFDYNLTQCQMADMMNLDLSTYLYMECGFDTISVEKYKKALALFRKRVNSEE